MSDSRLYDIQHEVLGLMGRHFAFVPDRDQGQETIGVAWTDGRREF